MPTPNWPRTLLPSKCTTPMGPGALYSWAQGGKGTSRATTAMGRQWTETYPPFKPTAADGAELVGVANEYWRAGTLFQIVPACYIGKPLLGGGTGSVTVNGASQTGTSLITTGWGGTNPVLKRGDLIQIIGNYTIRTITADVNRSGAAATLTLDPPLFIAPANSSAIAYGFSAMVFIAMLADAPTSAEVTADDYLAGFSLTFRECLPG